MSACTTVEASRCLVRYPIALSVCTLLMFSGTTMSSMEGTVTTFIDIINAIQDTLFSATHAISSSGSPYHKEPPLDPRFQQSACQHLPLNLEQRRASRPGHCCHILSSTTYLDLGCLASIPGHALDVGAERKLAAHAASCHSNGVHFFLLVVKTLGGWSREAIQTMSQIGSLQDLRSGSPPANCLTCFSSLPLVYGGGINASLWCRHQPACPLM